MLPAHLLTLIALQTAPATRVDRNGRLGATIDARRVLVVAIPATGALTYDVEVLGAGGSR